MRRNVFLFQVAATSLWLLLLLSSVALAGPDYEVVYSFAAYTNQSSGANADGVFPGEMVLGPKGVLYGTATGGKNRNGVVFSLTVSGEHPVFKLLHTFGPTDPDSIGTEFKNTDGISPSSLVPTINGDLMGLTQTGGAHTFGTVFQVSQLGHVAILNQITDDGKMEGNAYGNNYGRFRPNGADGFVGARGYQAGALYGLSAGGGLSELVEFDPQADDGTNDTGARPTDAPVLGVDNNLYGTARDGGKYDLGVIYRTGTSAGSITVIHDFDGGPKYDRTGDDGGAPLAGLILGKDGNFYGTTALGGAHGFGTVFMVGHDGSFRTLYSFTGGNDGGNPYTRVLLGVDGNIYGNTGGEGGLGSVFKLEISDSGDVTFTTLKYLGFTQSFGLTEGPDGNLYGIIPPNVSAHGTGGIFRLVTRLQPILATSKRPDVETKAASGIQLTTAVLEGKVNPQGLDTEFWFDYGLDATYGASTPMVAAGRGNVFLAEKDSVAGLSPHTIYHYRAEAKNAVGTATGDDATFTTLDRAPVAAADRVAVATSQTNPVSFDPLANDGDPDGDDLTVTAVSMPRHGMATILGNGPGNRIAYTPGPSYAAAGDDAFSYTVSDGFGGTSSAQVLVSASPSAVRAGQFTALLAGPDSTVAGFATLTLSANGSFTATVTQQGAKQVVRGVFDAMGHYLSADGKIELQWSADGSSADPGAYGLTGSVMASDGSMLTLDGQHAASDSKGHPSEAGPYTILLAPRTNPPAGTGYARLRVSPGGSVTITGKLADGTAFSASGPLTGDAAAHHLFNLASSTLYRREGLLVGAVTFERLTASACDGTLRWFKPAIAGATSPQGFDTELALTGEHYTPPASGKQAVSIPEGNLQLTGGGLAAASSHFTLSPQNYLVFPLPNGEHLTCQIISTTGLIRGTFIPPGNSSRFSFGGCVIQNSSAPMAGGFFLGPSVSGLRTSGQLSIVFAAPE